MKKTILKCSMFIAMLFGGSLVFQQCNSEDNLYIPIEQKETYSNGEYEKMLKTYVNSYWNLPGKYSEHFIGRNGIPVWEKLGWHDTENNRLITVPLVSESSTPKVLVALVKEDGIFPFVVETERLETRGGQQGGKIYTLSHVLLYDTERGGITTRALDNDIESTVINVFENNSDIKDIFNAAHEGQEYDGNMEFGAVKICTTMNDVSSLPTSMAGHSWIELEYGNYRTTISLYERHYIGSERDYIVDKDLNREVEASLSTTVTYDQVKKILDYNSTSANIDWSLNNNCTDYSINVWNLVSEQKIPIDECQELGITSPNKLTDYIKQEEK